MTHCTLVIEDDSPLTPALIAFHPITATDSLLRLHGGILNIIYVEMSHII